ncbi:MAG: hypothetical protein ACI9U2_000119 [Bradymonadia bacterium]|jgi:hypothetical protein
MRLISFLILPLAFGCDDAAVSVADAEFEDAVVADAAPVDGALPDDGLRDAGPAAIVDAGPPGRAVLNEVVCGDAAQVEIFAPDGAVDLMGWSLVAGQRTLALEGMADPFAVFEMPVYCGVSAARLVDATGAEVDQIAPPLDVPAASHGRLPDGDGAWQRTQPTPSAPNLIWAPDGSLFEPVAVHVLRIDLTEASATALYRESRREVDASFVVDGQDGLPARVQVFGSNGRRRRFDQKSGWRVRAALSGLGGLEIDGGLVDPAVLTRWLASRMLRQAGVWVPRVGFAALAVADKPLGLHVFEEPLLPSVLDTHFASTWHVYRGNQTDFVANNVLNFSAITGPIDDRRDLRWAAEQLVATDAISAYERANTVLDWDATVRVLAAEAWIGNVEGYGPGRSLMRVHFNQDGQLHVIPDGLDRALRSAVDLYGGNTLLWNICRAEPDCRDRYEAALIDITERLAQVDWVAELAQTAALLRPFVATDPQSYWSAQDFDREVAGIAAFLITRSEQLGTLAECLRTEGDPDGDGVRCAADCAPDDPRIHSGARDTCGNGIDEDCNGVPDDGLSCPICTPIGRADARYLVCTRRTTYRIAESICESVNAVPVKIDSANENSWLHRTARGVAAEDFWIGLTDRETEGAFVWADGTSDEAYNAWAGGEPNDYGDGEDCTHFRGDARWNDTTCDGARAVICELPCEAADADGDGADACTADCDDTDPERNPDAEDLCDDGIDQDCDGLADEGCGCSTLARGGRAYRFCPAPVTYDAALAACAEEGLALVEVDSPAENAWVWQTARSRAVQRWWIGLSDRAEEGAYRTLDNRRVEFGSWRRGEPNDGGRSEDCVHFWEDAPEWNDARCASEHGTICEPLCDTATDVDGDGASGCGEDCDDADPARAPGLTEACNAIDDDCDGVIDEGC